MRNIFVIAAIAFIVMMTSCSHQPKVTKIISGKAVQIAGKSRRCDDFIILVDTGRSVITTMSDNTFWDFDGASVGDSVLVKVYANGSATAHTYHTRSMMVQQDDEDDSAYLKGIGSAYK